MPLEYERLHHKHLYARSLPLEDAHDYNTTRLQKDNEGFDELKRVLESPPTHGHLPKPESLMPGVCIGSSSHADSVYLLKQCGITHILNCAGDPSQRGRREEKYAGSFVYEELPIKFNTPSYDISHYFDRAIRLINQACIDPKSRVLLHCPDADRSGAIAIAYMCRKGLSLIDAAKKLKQARRKGISNPGFLTQLVEYARDYGVRKDQQRITNTIRTKIPVGWQPALFCTFTHSRI